MADISGYEQRKKQESELEQAVELIMKMPADEIHQKIKTMTDAIESLTPYVNSMNARIKQGDVLSVEEKQTLDQMSNVLKKAVDFVVMAKQGLMNKLMAVADSYYYALKAEADKGDEEAKQLFEQLKAYKQDSIRSEFPENNN